MIQSVSSQCKMCLEIQGQIASPTEILVDISFISWKKKIFYLEENRTERCFSLKPSDFSCLNFSLRGDFLSKLIFYGHSDKL